MYSTINLAVWTGFNILEKTSYVCVACFWSYIVVLIGKIYGGYIGDVKPVAHMIGKKREPADTREFISTSILCILIYKNVYIETLTDWVYFLGTGEEFDWFFIFGVFMPLSAIFQLYHGDPF